MRKPPLVLLWLMIGCGSGDAGSLRVDVRTDYVASNEFSAVRVRLEGADREPVDRLARPGDVWVEGVVAARFEDLEPGTLVAVVEVLDGTTPIASRRVRVAVRGDGVSTVVLTRDCFDVMCPGASDLSATECLGGRCVTEDCSPENPTACPEPECAADTDCPAVACGGVVCRAGVCLADGDDAMCEAGESCAPDRGCERSLPPTGRLDQTRLVSASAAGGASNGASYHPDVSDDGRFVVFLSEASDLIEDDTNGVRDVFVRDVERGITERASFALGEGRVQSDDVAGNPSISGDGRYVAYMMPGHVRRFDRMTGLTERVDLNSAGEAGDSFAESPSLSFDGRYVAFLSASSNLGEIADDNDEVDVFRRDMVEGVTVRVSAAPGGAAGNGSAVNVAEISSDGGFIVFESFATNLDPAVVDTNDEVDVFLADFAAREVIHVSQRDGVAGSSVSQRPRVSSGGERVVFQTRAFEFFAGFEGDEQIMFWERSSGGLTLVSTAEGGDADDGSNFADVSTDGEDVAFVSFATNLVTGDTNGAADVFVRNLSEATTRLVSTASDNTLGNGDAGGRFAVGNSIPALSGSGDFVVFGSFASNLAEDGNSAADLFIKTLRVR